MRFFLLVLCVLPLFYSTVEAGPSANIQIINKEKNNIQIECCDNARCFGRHFVNSNGGKYDFKIDTRSNTVAPCSIWYNGPEQTPIRFDAWQSNMGDLKFIIRDKYLYRDDGNGERKYIKLAYNLKNMH